MGRVNKRARPWRSILAALAAFIAAAGSVAARDAVKGSANHAMWILVSIGAGLLFAFFAASATLGLSKQARAMLQPKMGSSHATMVRVVIVLIGWATILTVTLDLLGIPIGRLILGGAVTGVLLGIAAQQTLANLFAGIVLLLARPFDVGDDIKLFSGPLGGPFEGKVLEIGLAYVRLETDDGTTTHLPNAQVLSAAAAPRPKPDESDEMSVEAETVPASPAGPEAVSGADLGAVPGVGVPGSEAGSSGIAPETVQSRKSDDVS